MQPEPKQRAARLCAVRNHRQRDQRDGPGTPLHLTEQKQSHKPPGTQGEGQEIWLFSHPALKSDCTGIIN